jgi:hypothetical protein
MQNCACASSIIIGKLNIFGLFKAIISIHSIIEIHLSIMPNTRKYFNLNLNWQKLYLAVKYGRTVCRLLDSHLENTAVYSMSPGLSLQVENFFLILRKNFRGITFFVIKMSFSKQRKT